MSLEGEYFVFDLYASYLEGPIPALVVMQVINGTLCEKFNPADHIDFSISPDEAENIQSPQYLNRQGVKQAYTVTKLVESPAKFLNHILWWRKKLTDPDLVSGQWDFYHYSPVEDEHIQMLHKQGIEVIALDPEPYTFFPPNPPRIESEQLSLFKD